MRLYARHCNSMYRFRVTRYDALPAIGFKYLQLHLIKNSHGQMGLDMTFSVPIESQRNECLSQ